MENHKQNANGSHCSLLIFDKTNNIFKHYESIKGLNYCLLAKQINPNLEIILMETLHKLMVLSVVFIWLPTVNTVNAIQLTEMSRLKLILLTLKIRQFNASFQEEITSEIKHADKFTESDSLKNSYQIALINCSKCHCRTLKDHESTTSKYGYK